MNENLISVIIPVFNGEKYLLDTLKSIVNQTYKDIEIVIIDDGSTDNSKNIIELIKSDKIKYNFQQNQGVSAARNRGIKIAKGKYVAFLDSDDMWRSNKLEWEMNKIKSTNSDACYCGLMYFDDFSNIYLNAKTKFYSGSILVPILKDKIFAHTSTWLIKKNILLKNNITFTEKCSWAEDLEFFIKVATFAKACYVEDHLSIYRRGGSESLSSINLKQFEEIEMLYRLEDWFMDKERKIEHVDYIIKIIKDFRIPYTIARILHFESINSNLNKYEICSKYVKEIEILKKHRFIYGDIYHKIKYSIFKREFLKF